MKKRKLNSKNPKYKGDQGKEEKRILRRELMCKAKIRTSGGTDTGRTADVHGVWYE